MIRGSYLGLLVRSGVVLVAPCRAAFTLGTLRNGQCWIACARL